MGDMAFKVLDPVRVKSGISVRSDYQGKSGRVVRVPQWDDPMYLVEVPEFGKLLFSEHELEQDDKTKITETRT